MRGAELDHIAYSAMIIGRDLMLDLLKIASGGLSLAEPLDPVDTVLFLATMQANTTSITSRPDLQLQYGDLDGLPPDDVRRPVSASALARSLSLPFETVRRRMARLCATGWCAATPEGLVVPAQSLSSLAHVSAVHSNLAMLREAYRRLVAVGFLEPAAPLAGSRVANDADGLLIAARFSTEYFLRIVDPLTASMDSLLDGFIVLQVHRANTVDLGDRRVSGPAPDAQKQPVATSAVARALGMSPETARRRLKALVADGMCRQQGGGVIVPMDALMRPEIQNVMAQNRQSLARMFRGLESFGLTQAGAAGTEPALRSPA